MATGKKHSRIIGVIAIALDLVALALVWQTRPGYEVKSGFTAVEDAYRYRQTGFMAEVEGSDLRAGYFIAGGRIGDPPRYL